jgi:hypothetical protein
MSEGGIGISFSAPAAQLAGAPAPGERGGARTDSITFQCGRSASGGLDALAITFDHTV